ncbi:MAG: glnG 5 [Verrucomicrobiales bacterium]|nr:glnG 5 [Verrucomicrobiales bacterium]MDB6129447.1 glnG 5 [Verrucomicrobiales bacterium]
MNSIKILLIEDDVAAAQALEIVLQGEMHEVMVCHRGDEGLRLAESDTFDLVITDLKLPGMDGLQLVKTLHTLKPKLPIILMTAHGTTETAIEATKHGAYDYLLKPFEMEKLLQLVSDAVRVSRLMSEPVLLNQGNPSDDSIIGSSPLMQEIFKEIGRIANSGVSVLIRGETGTGKELIARAIYQHSNRAEQPFVAINCAAIPETLLESELFGYERGAFTGAEVRRIGKFEQANGGTIFLDEIGDMSAGTQAKLLRVLQEKTIQRLGGKETVPVNVRVLAATHRDLELAFKNKEFREDLYYRLNVVTIQVPHLRQHLEDVPALVQYFLGKHGRELGLTATSIHADAVHLLQKQPWPGNIRELENMVRQAILLARNYTIGVQHIEQLLRKPNYAEAEGAQFEGWINDLLQKVENGEILPVYRLVIDSAEKRLFELALRAANGNQAKVSRWLGISRLTLREKLIAFGIHPAMGSKKEP